MTGPIDRLCREHVDRNIWRWQQLLGELVSERSVFEHEHAVVERVERRIRASGSEVTRVRHDAERLRTMPGAQPPFSTVEGRFSLISMRKGTGGGRSIILSSHMDIVEEGAEEHWVHAPFRPEIDAERRVMYGRGVMDDKAGVVISLAVMETLAEVGVSVAGDVMCHHVLEDEVTGNGTLLCLSDGPKADAAVIIDGTRGDRAINEHAGNLQFQVELRGRPASVSVAHTGVNAAEVLSRSLIGAVDDVRALNETRTKRWRVFPSPYQFVILGLESAGAQLTVPDKAQALCHVTFPPPTTAADMRAFLEARITSHARQHGMEEPPSFDWMRFSANPVRSDSASLEEVMQRVATDLGMGTIASGPSTGTSDLRHFVRAGIPALLYGPGRGYNPHRPDECYELDDLRKMILFFLMLIMQWSGPPWSSHD